MLAKLKRSRHRVLVPAAELSLFDRMVRQQLASEREFLADAERELVDPAEKARSQASLEMCVRILAEDLPWPGASDAGHPLNDEDLAEFLQRMPLEMLSRSQRVEVLRSTGGATFLAIAGSASVVASAVGSVKAAQGRKATWWLAIGLGGAFNTALDVLMLFPQFDRVTIPIARRLSRIVYGLDPSLLNAQEARSPVATEPPES